MPHEPMRAETDVLVIGSGGAGMYAAIEAARAGCRVLLADRSLIGRGGATVMAQMTVAVALGAETPDHWTPPLSTTRSRPAADCATSRLARLLCEEGPDCIREMDEWGVGWARKDGHITQAMAPGHDRPRCVYVDFLNTGPAVSKTLRTVVNKTARHPPRRRPLRRRSGQARRRYRRRRRAASRSGAPVTIAAKATIIATGGLTRLYRRNSASANMGGDGYALALRAGASLVDMEFVQFFPIGHLAPRLIGMDPIMWDPFRYKLGGRLLNSRGEEFTQSYGVVEDGKYVITRDTGSYAILKEVEAGRGSPHGGAYLSFQHVPEAQLRAAFGPVIDRLAKNGIDLTKMAVEVAPIAHYHMGGIAADDAMATGLPGLFAAGEAVGGANGANRLSGNAVTEALVFGRRAGQSAAAHAKRVSPCRGRRQCRTKRSTWSPPTRRRAISIPPPCCRNCKRRCRTTSARCAASKGSRARWQRSTPWLTSSAPCRPAPPLAASTCAGWNGLTCATCCSLRARWQPQRWRARKPAARSSARTIRRCSPDWAVNQFVTLRGGEIALSREARVRRDGRIMSERATLTVWRGNEAAGGPLGKL